MERKREQQIGLREQIGFNLKLGLSLIALSYLCFSQETKQRVRENQHYRCDDCGVHQRRQKNKLQIHHRLPQSLGGSDDMENAVGLCELDHKRADKAVFERGIIYRQVHGKS